MGGFRKTDPETSRIAYERMDSDGSLSRRRIEIVEVMSWNPEAELTAGEISSELIGTNRNNVATRLSELEQLGVVEKCEERACSISGMLCWTWQMTGEQPSGRVVRKVSNESALRKALERISNEGCFASRAIALEALKSEYRKGNYEKSRNCAPSKG